MKKRFQTPLDLNLWLFWLSRACKWAIRPTLDSHILITLDFFKTLLEKAVKDGESFLSRFLSWIRPTLFKNHTHIKFVKIAAGIMGAYQKNLDKGSCLRFVFMFQICSFFYLSRGYRQFKL